MKLHHHGYVVEDVDAFAQCYPCAEFVARTYDPEQKADLLLAKAGGTFVEFIAPKHREAFTYNFQRHNRNGLHHIAYDIESLDSFEDLRSSLKLVVVRGPLYAPLLDRDVIFAVTRKAALLEFLI